MPPLCANGSYVAIKRQRCIEATLAHISNFIVGLPRVMPGYRHNLIVYLNDR